MKVYSVGNLFAEYKNFIKRQNENFLLKLHGIDISRSVDGMEVTPVYIPLFSYTKSAGIRVLEIHFWRESSWNIYFLPYWPFIYAFVSRTAKVLFSEDEE